MKRRRLTRQGQAHLRQGFGGQVVIEYTVLFGIIAVVTAIATAAFFTRICRSENGTAAFERYSDTVQQQIINH